MGSSFNQVVLLGNLTRDPELRYIPSGTAVTDLGLAINTKHKNREETCFVDVTVWGKSAEACCEYMRKGRQVLVNGRLVTESWDDRETGRKRSKIKVVAEGVQFIGSGERGSSQNGNRQRGDDRQARQGDDPDMGQDDIPF